MNTFGNFRAGRACVWLVGAASIFASQYGYAVQVDFQLVGPNSLLNEPVILQLGEPMVGQGAGGAGTTTTYSGTITVDVDNLANPTTIALISGNMVAANSGDWLPQPGGGAIDDPGTPAPANYGFYYETNFGSGPTRYWVASRDGVLSVDTTDVGALPITGGQFNPFGIGFSFPQGTFDGNLSSPDLPPDVVSEPLSDQDIVANCTDETGTDNRCGSLMGTYSVTGNLATLTLPVNFLFGGGTPEVTITGTLTATYSLVVPLQGDYNNNGTVDAADYVVWRNGDSPDDSPAGYDLWKANFGKTADVNGSGSTLGAVPEPASAALIIFGLVGLLFSRRRNTA